MFVTHVCLSWMLWEYCAPQAACEVDLQWTSNSFNCCFLSVLVISVFSWMHQLLQVCLPRIHTAASDTQIWLFSLQDCGLLLLFVQKGQKWQNGLKNESLLPSSVSETSRISSRCQTGNTEDNVTLVHSIFSISWRFRLSFASPFLYSNFILKAWLCFYLIPGASAVTCCTASEPHWSPLTLLHVGTGNGFLLQFVFCTVASKRIPAFRKHHEVQQGIFFHLGAK